MNRENQFRKRNNSSLLGLLVILFGILLLIDSLIPGIYFLNRLFSWPMILIAVGLAIGHRNRYLNPISYILIGVGVFFLVLNLFHIQFNILFWPVILIAVGFSLITNRSRKSRMSPRPTTPKEPLWDKRVYDEKEQSAQEGEQKSNLEYTDFIEVNEEGDNTNGTKENVNSQSHSNFSSENESTDSEKNTRDDYIDSTSVFSSNKINVVSRNFKGGNIVNIFGGTEINLIHADLTAPASLEVVQLFGGSTIIAPAHWVIQPEMASFFGGIEDKRFTNSMPDSSKVLYIRGTSLFGGITIKSM